MNKTVYLDFEYNNTTEKDLNLVCAVLLYDYKYREFWLHKNKYADLTKVIFELINNGYTFVSFSVEAEARSILSLGIDVTKMKWIDLQLEYKMLLNHHVDFSSGKHLIKGRETLVVRGFPKPQSSLVSCCYKLLGVSIDTEHKNTMRDLIIASPKDFSEDVRKAILEYCKSDVKYLPELLNKVMGIYSSLIPRQFRETLISEMLWRGEYSARTAVMVRHGYPINVEWARNLASNVPSIYTSLIQDINEQFPDIKPFRFDRTKSSYVLDTKAVRKWIEDQKFSKWLMTDGGARNNKQYSLSLEAWEDHFTFRHNFPRGNFGAQMVRYLKTRQSLNSFNIKEDAKDDCFFDFLGSDGFVRPYMNHYGAQSSRTQPSSTSFLFLKGAWCRAICQPPKGKAIVGIDYASQEFLLSAVMSGDSKMVDAYRGGDPYLYYAKGIGLIPPEGTKETHSKERDLAKSTVLGLSYLMTKVGLSKKLTSDTGSFVSEDKAQDLVDKFDRLFSKFSSWRNSLIENYMDGTKTYIRLLDGYYMWGSNPNPRSVGNVPLQGAGACIMRKAVQLCQDRGLTVIFTLHDALYIMIDVEDLDSIDIFRASMYEAFIHYFDGQMKEDAKLIRMDAKMWGPDIPKGTIYTPCLFEVETSEIHIDKRAKEEYDLYNKHFLTNNSAYLL
jgi:hypothetical protein